MRLLELALSFIDLRSFLVCASVFLIIFWYLRRPRNLPPGPWGIPVLGCLPMLTLALYKSGLKPHKLFKKFATRYGDIFSMQMFGINIVVLNSYDDIKVAFQNPNLNDRPHPFLFVEELNLKPGVAIASGESWKQQRKFTLSTLRGFGVGKRSFEDQVSTETKALVKEFLLQQEKPFDPRPPLGNAVSNVICSVIFGKRYEYSDEKFKHLLSNLNELVQVVGAAGLHIFVPFTKYLQPQTHKRVTKIIKSMVDFVEQIIDEHRLVHDPNDFIDVFLTETDLNQNQEKDNQSYLNKEELGTTIVNLFGAGSETTATTLCWSLTYMVLYPDVQCRIQQEIDDIVGRNRAPRLSDRPNLAYTEATLLEIQRIASVAPLGVMHRAAESTILKGFHIPKGTYLLPNLWAVHNDPNVWKEPSKFRPSRFLDQSGNVQERAELSPFSIGRRICLGENLAKMELFLFFTHMLHQFTFTKPTDSASFTFDGLGGAIDGPESFKIIATPRD